MDQRKGRRLDDILTRFALLLSMTDLFNELYTDEHGYLTYCTAFWPLELCRTSWIPEIDLWILIVVFRLCSNFRNQM